MKNFQILVSQNIPSIIIAYLSQKIAYLKVVIDPLDDITSEDDS